MLNPLSTIAEIDAALAAGTATLVDAHAVLVPRSMREASRTGARAHAWLVANPLDGSPVPATPPASKRSVKAAAKGAPAAAARAVGIGARGGDVRWGIASALTKGQGYEARRELHDQLAMSSENVVRQFAESQGLVIAANAVIPPAETAAA